MRVVILSNCYIIDDVLFRASGLKNYVSRARDLIHFFIYTPYPFNIIIDAHINKILKAREHSAVYLSAVIIYTEEILNKQKDDGSQLKSIEKKKS